MDEARSGRCGWYGLGAAVTVLLLVSLVAVPWGSKWNEYRRESEKAAQRVARYASLLQSRGELVSRLKLLRDQIGQGGYFITAENAELAAAELQRAVKEIVEKSGGTLVSTQSISGEPAGRLVKIEIKVRMKGDMESLARTLFELENSNPVVSIESISIRSRRLVRGRRKNRVESYVLDVGFNVVGFLAGTSR